jgi:hypothetical protein
VKRAGELGGCAMDNGTKRQRDHGKMDNRTVDHGARAMGHWDNENGRTGQGDNGTMGFLETGTMGHRSNGTQDIGTLDK